MATSESGIPGSFKGRIGNTVYYFLNGKWVSRSVARGSKPPTVFRRATQAKMGLGSTVLRDLKPFINVGFRQKAIVKKDNPSNVAKSYLLRHAMAGQYPDISIDYAKLLVSEGPLLPAQDFSVVPEAEGLRFSWFADPGVPWPDYTDQVMMLAYFPVLGKAVCELYGPQRSQGTALLPVSAPMQSEYMETYVAFIAADRSATSISVYTGSFNAIP